MCTVSIMFNDLTTYQAGLLMRLYEVLKKFPAPGCGREGMEDELSALYLQQLHQELEVACEEYFNQLPTGGGNEPPDI
ncbi:MAG TPA: hypothetical protein VMY98_07335 [Anaerolineae bacterium]|nr:hypothetical protein [Anaerolineae bacterium]